MDPAERKKFRVYSIIPPQLSVINESVPKFVVDLGETRSTGLHAPSFQVVVGEFRHQNVNALRRISIDSKLCPIFRQPSRPIELKDSRLFNAAHHGQSPKSVVNPWMSDTGTD